MQDYTTEPEYSNTYKSVMSEISPSLVDSKASLLEERKTQKQVDLGLFNSSRSATPKEGYVDVNRSALEGTIIPGVSTGYYPKELVEQYQQPQQQEKQDALAEQKQAEDAYRMAWAKTKYEDEGVLDKAKKFVAAIPAGAAKGAVELADVIQEVVTSPAQAYMRSKTGDSKYDIDFLTDDTKKEFQGRIDKAVGYDRATTDYATSMAMEQLKESGAEFSWEGLGKLFTDPKQRDALLNAMKTGAVNPDIISGSIAELFGGGGVAGAAVKGTGKVAGAVAGKIDDVTGAVSKEAKAVNAGEDVVTKDGVLHMPVTPPSATDIVNNISDALKLNSTKLREELAAIDKSGLGKAEKAAAIAQLEKTYTFGKATADMIKGSIMTNAYAANLLNNHIQQFKDNNNGEDPTIGKLAEMGLYTKIASGTEIGGLKYAFGIKTLPAAEKKEIAKASVAGTVASVAGKLGIAGGFELGQEILENVVEELNTKLDSADYEGKSAQEILQEASAKIIASGAMGAVGGVQMKAAGMAAQPLTDAVVNGTRKAVDKVASMQQKPEAVASTPEVSTVNSDAELAPKDNYLGILKSVSADLDNNLINNSNLADYVTRLEDMQSLRHELYDAYQQDPELVEALDTRYKMVATKINSMITDSNATDEQLRLTRRLSLDLPAPEPKAEVLGSQDGEVVITQGEYTDADRKSDAERILHFVIGNEDLVTPELASKYGRFATVNGVELERLNTIIKSYESVEDEASVGRRGWKTYETKIDSLMAASNPDSKAITTQYRNLNNWLMSTLNAKAALEEGIKAANSRADYLNKQLMQPGKPQSYVTSYIKDNKKPFDITIKHDGKKWVADTTEAEKVLAKKYHNEEEIRRVIDKYNTTANQLITDINNVGNVIVPNSTSDTKESIVKERKKDSTYYTNQVSMLNEALGTARGVSKVLLDREARNTEKGIRQNTHSDKWKSSNPYSRANLALINTGNYNEGDIVLLNATGTFKTKDGIELSSLFSKNSEARKELDKVVAARASIVLDREYVAGKSVFYTDKNGKKRAKELAGGLNAAGKRVANVLKSQGYVALPGSQVTFVHGDTYKDKLAQAKKSYDEAVHAKSVVTKNKNKLVETAIKLEYAQANALGDEVVADLVNTLEDLRKEVLPGFTLAALKASETKVDEDADTTTTEIETAPTDIGTVADEDVDSAASKAGVEEDLEVDDALAAVANNKVVATPEQKLEEYIERVKREMLSSVTNDAAYTEAPFNEGKWNKDAVKMILSLRKDQELAVAAEEDVKVNEFLAEWSKLVDLGLRGTELDEEVAKLVKDLDGGLVNLSGKASTISKDLLNTALGNGKPDVYEVVYKLVKADGTTEVTQSLRLSADAASKYLEDIGKKYNTTSGSLGEFVNGIKKIPLYVRKVVLDPNNIVTAASKATLLNTLPVDMLPSALRDEVKKFANTAEKVIRPATKAEMQDSKEFSSVGKEDDTAKFLLHNDPARGLVYNVSGKLSPQVVAAMYLAVGEALVTDKMKLMLGSKDDAVIAKMFGVHESAVTKKMRDHAREHGMLRKTLANALGKDILKQLGYVNKKDDATGIGHYEALVASIGNMAVTVAEKHGLLETKKVGSSVLAEMYPEHDKEGKDQFSDKATTAFVHLQSIPETKGKYTRHKVKASVEKFTDTYKSNAEKLPGAKTRSTVPVSTPLTSDEIERQLTSVRNDITGIHKIPEVAKESLRHMMNTEYVFDHARGKELVDAYDDDVIGPQLKASLGYIEIDSEEYNNLPYRDKEIQPAINMGVEKAFEHIRGLVEKGSDVSMWFNHYFSSNGRFFIDSNGVNPQTDKLMRFLTQPKSHKVTHKVDKSKGSPRFSKDGIDTSYYVRVGLAQAFGMGIDKEDPISTIRLGNVLLSLNKDQLKDLRNKFLTSKESVVISASVGKSTVEYKVEPEHLSHALQGIKFLEDVLDGDTVTSSLTAEFDALTSGFANKTQQFPILVDADGNSTMDDHMLRVGILIPSKLAAYEEEMHIDYNGSKVFIGSISTVIKHGADKTPVFYDSYQNMAVTVGDTSKAAFDSIKRNEKGSIADSQVQAKDQIVKLASEMESMLPRPDVNGKVTKALRTLFKSPFMVFNYSAGIKTIRENLSHDVVQDIMHKIAKNDDVGKQIAENLIKGGLSLDDKKATTVEQLVEFVRTEPITSNKLKMKGTKAIGYSMMVKIVDATFGKAVEETFKSNFGKFIEIQDTVNDAFKVSFTRFEYAFNDKYKAKMDANGYVTEKEVQGIIEDLWDMFPWIKGPLTEGSNDVIPVVDVDTRDPGVMSGRAAPQTAIVVDGKNTSEKVHPIIRRLKAATSAGSVLPFHYIDGAQLARTVNELSKLGTMDEVGVLPVHDAITMPIHMMDTAANIFNKEWFHTGMEYSLIDSIVDMVNKWDNQVTLNQDTAKVKGLKAFQKGGYAYDESKKDGQNNTLTNAQAVIKEKLLKLQEEINKGREDYYAKAADPSSGYVYNNVVGTVGGAYKVGEDSPNQEYLKVFDGEYKTVKAELGKTAEEFESAVAKAKSVDAVNNGPLGNPTIAKLIKGMYPNDKKNAVELFIEGCK